MAARLILGECSEVLSTFEPESVDLTITSPPYDNLRTYNGYVFDFEPIARKLYRVTKPGGVVVWVVGDATIDGSETGTSFRQALYFKEIGFNLHDTMIYSKGGQGATGSNLSYWQDFEYMFIFAKGKPEKFHPIEDRKNIERPDKQLESQGHRHANGNHKGLRVIERKSYGRRLNIWQYHESGTRIDHPAVFPEALARDHILSWSNPGDTVLDPMMGSGTTGKMAVLYQRNFIGIEISREYYDLAEKRIAQAQRQMIMPLEIHP